MPLNFSRARPLLQEGKLKQLFVEELGWEPCHQQMDLAVGEKSFRLTGVAEKKGMVVWQCESQDGHLPDHATRLKLDRQVTQTTFEHLLVFVTRDGARQSWMWVRREPGRPVSARTHEYLRGQPGDSLLQKLQLLFVSLDEEEAGVSVAEIAARARTAFNVDRVVKRFYEQFRKEHAAFLKFITGISDTADHEWYASVMLNRLMFVYFIQCKGFLDGDSHYLRNRLQKMQREHGKDKFYSFYRYFLLRLFHEGLGGKQRSPALEKLLGRVPYLNGGIFDTHELERPERYGKVIQIPDKAFERIFDFFDQWHWHLDDRPLRADNEINPDVLGYIYEKYINQKQMGAYYTKEDITEYISKNTIIPFLFDAARAKYKVAFENPGGPTVWDLLKNDPDRYIYPAVKHGISWDYYDQKKLDKPRPLPPEIEKGVNPPTLHQPVGDGPILTLELRKDWNKPAPSEYALPTEIWREVVARRQRYAEIKARLIRSGTGSGTGSGSGSGTGVPPVSPVSSPASSYFDPSCNADITRRNLPHWDQEGRLYFVTFRLFDSLPAAQLSQWKKEQTKWLRDHPEPRSEQERQEYARLFSDRIEQWLDQGAGSCLLADPAVSAIVERAMQHFDGERYELDDYVIMPNHVHVIFAPLPGHSRPDILHSWKSFTAHQINKHLARKGSVWQDESFDHLIRNQDHHERYRRYIQENPVKASLRPGEYRLGQGKGHRRDACATATANTTTTFTASPLGGITDINDFITLNLDIRQFAQDVIETCEEPDLLRAFWHAIEKVTILDPTCGSGAFLFAALNILEPIYEACLDRMEAFLQDEASKAASVASVASVAPVAPASRRCTPHGIPILPKKKYSDFTEILHRVAEHPSRQYFIYKSIILNNLYGVDIMEEAVEICKLRLFLKLAAQVEADPAKPNFGIEPLPDIDFNIRAGNTLVGFASLEEIRSALGSDLIKQLELPAIESKAADADRAFKLFREMQTEGGMDARDFVDAKRKLRERLNALEQELNCYLASDYDIKTDKKAEYQEWLKFHQPFHWFVEFYGIITSAGFDVIIGNPPYVEYSKVQNDYKIPDYKTKPCGNLYAFVIERSLAILQPRGLFGMIVPLSIATTKRMKPLQDLLTSRNRLLWLSHYDVYPCKLFEGAKQRLTIVLLRQDQSHTPTLFSTRYSRWIPTERDQLISRLAYEPAPYDRTKCAIPKLTGPVSSSILQKLAVFDRVPYARADSNPSFYVHRIPYNYIKCFDFVPYFWNETDGRKKSEDYKPYALRDPKLQKPLLAILNSNLFFWYWHTFFEGYHCGRHEIYSFPAGPSRLANTHKSQLDRLARQLIRDIQSHKSRKQCQYKTTGKVVYDEFYPKLSKPIIDQIDTVLAEHYGFTEEELDFIINYDIKYRMGRDADSEDEV